jgi:RNA polymerase sigma-70 factor, ECF subfamily
MHGLPNTVSSGAPLQFSPVDLVLSETSVRAIERGIKYLALELAPTEDRQDDLVSVSLRAIHYAQATYDSRRGASIETFLIHCSYRAMLDFLRPERRQTVRWISGDAPINAEASDTLFDTLPCTDPDSNLYQNTLFRQVELALEELPQRQRECIQMSYYEGQTNSEIAMNLGIPRPRVTQLLSAGLRQLRARLTFHALTPTHGVN